MGGVKTRSTVDADPARVCHNISIAIDDARMLFNGQPATVGAWIDALNVTRGARVLHVGSGLGYYTALMAHCVGSEGRVVAFEADEELAQSARANLSSMPWVDLRASSDAAAPGETFDAILVNAGMTHPLQAWLDALAIGGRMILPLTSTMPAMAHVGKGLVLLVTRESEDHYSARVTGFAVIYSAVGLRERALNDRLGQSLAGGPQKWMGIARLRRDPHDPSAFCWLHDAAFCLSS
jgi:protein-L-isoaspartate(D-aspartate) O-methyltransferase